MSSCSHLAKTTAPVVNIYISNFVLNQLAKKYLKVTVFQTKIHGPHSVNWGIDPPPPPQNNPL